MPDANVTGRCLMTVHAHPDDESEFGASTVARYHHEGVRTVLVCCTDGGMGRNINPEVGPIGHLPNIVEIRRQELAEATAIIGYDEVVMLGYSDSGNITEQNRPDGRFAAAPLDEAVGRLVTVVRRERPQVLVTYCDDHTSYPHLDHIRAQEIAFRAFDDAGNPAAYPGSGPPWQPLKLYSVVTSRERRRVINDKYAALGIDPPFNGTPGGALQGQADVDLAPAEERVTTRIDVRPFAHAWMDAISRHRCQVYPKLVQTLSIPREAVPDVFDYEEYILARDLTEHGEKVTGETDLFARVPGRP